MPSPAVSYDDTIHDLVRGGLSAGLVGFFVNLLHLSLPLFTIQVYDRVLSSHSMETLLALVILVSILIAFQTLLDILRQQIFIILGGRVLARLGRPVLESAVETSLKEGSGAASSVMRDVTDLRAFVTSGAIAMPIDMVMTPLFLAVLFMLSPMYGVVGAVGVALLSGAAILSEYLVRRPAAEGGVASARLQAEAAEAIRQAELVTAMGMLPALAARWHRAQGDTIRQTARSQRLAKLLATLTRTLRIGLQVAVVATGAILVSSGAASSGTIIAAAVTTARLLNPFEQMMSGWRQWIDAAAATARLRDVTRSGSVDRDRVPVTVATGRLVADRLTYIPGNDGRPILRNVSFELEEGRMLGVIGPSGAGKTTFAKMIVGIWQPSAGGVYLDGLGTFAHERVSFGQAVGYLPQHPEMFSATVRDNIARFGDADMAEVVRAARAAGVHEMIGALPRGYGTRIGSGGVALSGGQRQRVALARALFGNPRLIVLDEPNAHLDADGEAALITALASAQARGTSVVMVAQRMAILHRADLLLMLKEGAVAHLGPKAEVMAAIGPQRVARSGKRENIAGLRA